MTDGRPFRELLRRRALSDGERPAVVTRERALGYRELAEAAAAASERLRAAGVGSGARVALEFRNSAEYVIWFFGILEAGGVAVPLSPSTAPAERDALFRTGGVAWTVSPGGVAPTGAEAAAAGAGDDLAALQFSSGSTGRPRAVPRTGANFAADAEQFTATLGIGPDDRFLGVAPFLHAFGELSYQAAFAAGASVIALPRFLPGPVLEAALRFRPTVFLATPGMIAALGACALAAGEDGAFRALRYCICSGGSLGREAHDGFVARFAVPVRPQYGSTETLAATVDLDDGFEEGRVGRPYAGVSVGVFDDEGTPLPAGVPGAVGICSAAACAGYENDPVATADRFRGGWVFPGDRGVLDERSVLRLLGRSDVINVGGLKVDPLEVAGAIRAELPVSAVEITAGERGGAPALVAFVEADPAAVTPAMVAAACRARLSAHKVPAHVRVLREFPRNESGKVIRSSLVP